MLPGPPQFGVELLRACPALRSILREGLQLRLVLGYGLRHVAGLRRRLVRRLQTDEIRSRSVWSRAVSHAFKTFVGGVSVPLTLTPRHTPWGDRRVKCLLKDR